MHFITFVNNVLLIRSLTLMGFASGTGFGRETFFPARGWPCKLTLCPLSLSLAHTEKPLNMLRSSLARLSTTQAAVARPMMLRLYSTGTTTEREKGELIPTQTPSVKSQEVRPHTRVDQRRQRRRHRRHLGPRAGPAGRHCLRRAA